MSDKPEFPQGGQEPAKGDGSGSTPPLPDIPAWQTPAGDAAEPATPPAPAPVIPEPIRDDEMPAAHAPAPFERPVADESSSEPGVDTTATREPIGGPYVVDETGAPVAEQAVIAYDRQPLGGPYVTSSEPTPEIVEVTETGTVVTAEPAEPVVQPTPYPAAAFAPTVAAASYPAYQPVPEPISAPVPPRPKGNRGGGTLIALIGTVAFAIVYAGVAFLIIAANLSGEAAVTAFTSFLLTAAFIVPVVVFAISLILIVLIVNRAGWWAYVLGGFLVAVLVYFAGIAGALIHVQAWNWQPQEQYDFVRSLTMDPLTLAGAIVAREASIWTGAWIAARGRKLKSRNTAAREQYEREQTEAAAAPVRQNTDFPNADPAASSTTW